MRRRLLWVFGVLTLVVGVVLVLLDARMQDAGGHGIVDFEFAGSREEAAEIMADWGERGQRAARASLWLDFAYLTFYGIFLALASLSTRALFRREGMPRLARLGVPAAVAAGLGAVFDAIEDVNLLIVLDHGGGDGAARAATTCATLKFVLLAFAILYVLAGITLRLQRRFRRAA